MKRPSPGNGARGLALLALLLSLLSAGTAQPDHRSGHQAADSERPPAGEEATEPAPAPDAAAALASVAEAWLAADHTTLSSLVAADGVSIAILPIPERDQLYSSRQAFYFFKNLFQSTRTEAFAFQRAQQETEGLLAHGVAVWRYQRSGGSAVWGERLVFTLTLEAAGWRLSEIRTLR